MTFMLKKPQTGDDSIRCAERQINLPLGITGRAQPHKKLCRFAAVSCAILTAYFIGRELSYAA